MIQKNMRTIALLSLSAVLSLSLSAPAQPTNAGSAPVTPGVDDAIRNAGVLEAKKIETRRCFLYQGFRRSPLQAGPAGQAGSGDHRCHARRHGLAAFQHRVSRTFF